MQLERAQARGVTKRDGVSQEYLFAIESVVAYQPYTLSPEKEMLSAAATRDEWQSELY